MNQTTACVQSIKELFAYKRSWMLLLWL